MVLRLDPKDTTARLLSFPRDLWVPIAGTDTKAPHQRGVPGQRTGAAQRLIETIKLNFGIPIDHYVQVNFASFKKLVDSIDGVPIYFDEPVRAASSGPRHPVRRLLDARRHPGPRLRPGPQGLPGVPGRRLAARPERRPRSASTASSTSSGSRSSGPSRRASATRPRCAGWSTSACRASASTSSSGPSDVMDLGQRFRNFSPENLKTYTRAGGRRGPGRRAGARAAGRRGRADPHHLPGRAGRARADDSTGGAAARRRCGCRW